MADILMVGALGDTAIAAVGLAAKIHFLLLVAMSGLATACSVMVAQYYGAKKPREYQRTIAMTLIIGCLVMLPVSVFFFLSPSYWMPIITPDAAVSDLAANYLHITAPILLFTQLIVIYESSLRSLGNTTFPLFASVVSVLINVVLNYLLIFGHFGFPELGVAGAAWATLIARFIQLLVVLGWIYLTKHEFALSTDQFVSAANKRQMMTFVLFALPLIGNYAFWGIGNTVYHVLTGFAGTQALAVMGIIVPLEMCFLSLFLGIANASSVMIGQSLGAEKPEKAWHLYRFFDAAAIVLGVAMCLGLWFSRDVIVSLYAELTDDTSKLLHDIISVFCLCIWLKVLNLVRIVGVLRAGGDNQFCLKIDMTVMWLLGIPIYALAILLGNFSFMFLYTLTFLEDAAKCIPVRARLNTRRWLVNLTKPKDDSEISQNHQIV